MCSSGSQKLNKKHQNSHSPKISYSSQSVPTGLPGNMYSFQRLQQWFNVFRSVCSANYSCFLGAIFPLLKWLEWFHTGLLGAWINISYYFPIPDLETLHDSNQRDKQDSEKCFSANYVRNILIVLSPYHRYGGYPWLSKKSLHAKNMTCIRWLRLPCRWIQFLQPRCRSRSARGARHVDWTYRGTS